MKVTVKIDQVGITIDDINPEIAPTFKELEDFTSNLKRMVVQMNKAHHKDDDAKED